MQAQKSFRVISRLSATSAANLIRTNKVHFRRHTSAATTSAAPDESKKGQHTLPLTAGAVATAAAVALTSISMNSIFANSDASPAVGHTPAATSPSSSAACTSSNKPSSSGKSDWKHVIFALREAQRTHALGATFSASRRLTPDKQYSHDVEFPLRDEADIHAIISALSFFKNGIWLKVNDTPTRRNTNLSANDGKFEANIYIPRVKSIDGRVTLHIVKNEEEGFSDDEIHALVSAYRSSQQLGEAQQQHKRLPPHLLDGKFSVDIGPPSHKNNENNTNISPSNNNLPKTKSEGRFTISRQIDIDVDGEKHRFVSNDNIAGSACESDDEDSDDEMDENMKKNKDVLNLEEKQKNIKGQLKELGVDVMEPEKDKLSWEALAGYTEVKQHIEDTLILPLKHPDVYEKIVKGTRNRVEPNIPTGVLLYGPPGCGKTLSARILASTIGIPFIHIRVESLLSKYYGETTKKLAQILELSNSLGRCIIFIDECDSIGLKREGDGDSGGVHEVTRRTLSVLLRFIDGIEGSRDAIILAATNCKDDLDSALISRFDVIVGFPLPDHDSRSEMLQVYAKQLNIKDINEIANITWGFSGRELVDVCEEAERSKAGEIVRQREQQGAEHNEEVGLPTLGDYVKAVERKEEHVVGRTNPRFAKPEILGKLISPEHLARQLLAEEPSSAADDSEVKEQSNKSSEKEQVSMQTSS